MDILTCESRRGLRRLFLDVEWLRAALRRVDGEGCLRSLNEAVGLYLAQALDVDELELEPLAIEVSQPETAREVDVLLATVWQHCLDAAQQPVAEEIHRDANHPLWPLVDCFHIGAYEAGRALRLSIITPSVL